MSCFGGAARACLQHAPRPVLLPAPHASCRWLSSLPSLPPTPPSALVDPALRFGLDEGFVRAYDGVKPPFGFNGLGELVFRRTYSRLMDNGEMEEWNDTVARVVTGTFRMQQRWCAQHSLHWDLHEAQRTAQQMYDRIFHMKFLPPGRGLWAMGSAITEERGMYAALNNCGFVSTAAVATHGCGPFAFLMDAAMLGVGVGFDTKGAGTLVVAGTSNAPSYEFVIPDSREGWVESVGLLIDAHLFGRPRPEFRYDEVRPAGQPIRGFGGVSSGPGPLMQLHTDIDHVMTTHRNKPLSVTAIVDLMNLVGRCVVSGNVRRTAEIAFGEANSDEYINLKNYERNPHRAAYGWTSNNSVFAEIGMDYKAVCERVVSNGEPGFAWLHNMRRYGRMADPPNDKDARACGGNPCLEQTLESYELCCLVETFPAAHASLEDFVETLRFATMYAKTVTLATTHWPQANAVMARNRRFGASVSGVAQFVASRGLDELREWCEVGYQAVQEFDAHHSEKLAVPRSIKTTSVKPSGTVSLLAGATPGVHFPESRFYVRRVRLAASSPLLPPLRRAGYPVEQAVVDPHTVVVEFPVDVGENVRTLKEVSMWEQLSLASFMQRYWADNQVSCTVTFDPEVEGPQLAHALDHFQYQLKGVSFLPRMESGAYEQMPYEEIKEEEYARRKAALKPTQWGDEVVAVADNPRPDNFCDNDKCTPIGP